MHVKLYEDISQHGHIATAYSYPVQVEGRYVMDPSPIPKFDNPKMHGSSAIQLFGAGREQRIYAIPPYTRVHSLDFDDYPFEPMRADQIRHAPFAEPKIPILMRSSWMTRAQECSFVPILTTAAAGWKPAMKANRGTRHD